MSAPDATSGLRVVPRSGAPAGAFARPYADPRLRGLRFATESELAVALEFEAAGLFFLPTPRCRLTNDAGGRETRELDFLVIERGVPGVLELDGWPHAGRAAEDHARDRGIRRGGVWVVDRVPSMEALRAPADVAERFLRMLRSYRRSA